MINPVGVYFCVEPSLAGSTNVGRDPESNAKSSWWNQREAPRSRSQSPRLPRVEVISNDCGLDRETSQPGTASMDPVPTPCQQPFLAVSDDFCPTLDPVARTTHRLLHRRSCQSPSSKALVPRKRFRPHRTADLDPGRNRPIEDEISSTGKSHRL